MKVIQPKKRRTARYMSTKIYNGIRFRSRNLREVLSQLQSRRDRIVERMNYNLSKHDIHFFMNMHELTQESKWMDLRLQLTKALEKRYRPIWTPNFIVTLVIIPIKEDNDILGVIYADGREDIIRAEFNDILEDFGYWDNSDPDDDVTKEIWNERRRKWESLNLYKPMNELGFIYELVKPGDLNMTRIKTLFDDVVEDMKITETNNKEKENGRED